MPAVIARLLFLVPLLWLVGCATMPSEPSGPTDALAEALQTGDCRAAYALVETGPAVSPDQRLRVSQVCLQTGDFMRARRVAGDFLQTDSSHPDADYAAYLHALAGFGSWSRAASADPEVRIREGRAVFAEITAFLRDRPLSEYVQNLAPRLVTLREGIATAELALAAQSSRGGDTALARARAEYVVQYFPRTQAAADAARLLMDLDSR
jgi:outer membrane protein assembly factor BamD